MSSVLDILESIVKYGNGAQLTKYLKSCDESRAFSNDNEETSGVIAFTNRLLNENSSRRDGMLVLKCLVGQLPSEILQENLLSWIQQAVKGLSQKDSYSTVVVAADVACILLRLSTKFADCRKEVSLTIISKIFEILYDLKNSEELLKLVLSTLSTLLQCYNKSGGAWKDKFEKFLITLIENDDESVFLASRCYLALAASGPPGTDFTNYKENWIGQFKSLSTSLHLILDKLFDNVNEIEQFSRGRIKWKLNFQLPQVNERVPYLKMSRLTHQVSSLCQFLEVMLLGQFPVSKKVVPELLLSVACRGLAITPQTLQAHETSGTSSLLAVLPQLHSSCLGILIALIKSCRTNLITYGPMICKLLSQVLKTTELGKSTYGQNKPYRSVRILAYECLTSWLYVASCSSNVEKHPDMIDYLISDIQFKKQIVTLNISSKILKGKLGKKQRQALVNQTVYNTDNYVADRGANRDVCCAALRVVPALLESASSLLPPQAHKDLQGVITSELLMTQLNLGDSVPLPYSDKSCRLGLYKSFVACCLNYHPSFPPPLSFASQLITSGLQDPCHEIVQFCVMSSCALEKMLRPIGPTLSFPVELPDMFRALTKFSSLRKDSPKGVSCSDKHLEFSTNDQQLSTNNGDPTSPQPNHSLEEPEISLLLVDPEMSEFDFFNSSKDTAVGDEPKENRLSVLESTDESTAESSTDHTEINPDHTEINPKESDREIISVQTEITNQNGCREKSPENVLTMKRKTSPEPFRESPTPKKNKSDITDVSPSPDQLDGIPVQLAIDPVSDTTSVVKTIEDRTNSIHAPENDLEEEMLKSFVDVID